MTTLEERNWVLGSHVKRIWGSTEGEHEKRIRLRSPSPSLQEGVVGSTGKRIRLSSPLPSSDVCLCVRLEFKGHIQQVKWLRLKIPASLIEKYESGVADTDTDTFSPLAASMAGMEEAKEIDKNISNNSDEGGMVDDEDEAGGDGMGKETEMAMETTPQVQSWRDEDDSPRSDASSTDYDLIPSILHDWENIMCGLEPNNGPFEFTPIVKSSCCYPKFAACAAIGSVIYALGGDLDNIGDCGDDYLRESVGRNFADPRKRVIPRTIPDHVPSVCGGRPSPPSPRPAAANSASSNNVDTCHRFHWCDFSERVPKWQVSPHPLIAPRLSPKLLSFYGKIYAFGGVHPADEEAPFVEVYDPNLGFWEAIPNPPFGRLYPFELVVLPLPNSSDIFVFGGYSRISYKLDTLSWMWYPFPGCTPLETDLWSSIKSGSSPAIYDDTIYWINCHGPLSAFTFDKDKGGKYYEGLITGLEGLEIDICLKEVSDYPIALLSISRHVLALFWCSVGPVDFGYKPGSCLHIALLQVSLLKEFDLSDRKCEFGDRVQDLKHPSLTASVVASLSFPFPVGPIGILDAYFISRGIAMEVRSSSRR